MKVIGFFFAFCATIMVLGALSERPDKSAFIAVLALVLTIAALWAWTRFSSNRAWRHRAKRLCTNCFTVAQPLQKADGVLYCPSCQADNPAPLDSPFAQQHLARAQA